MSVCVWGVCRGVCAVCMSVRYMCEYDVYVCGSGRLVD